MDEVRDQAFKGPKLAIQIENNPKGELVALLSHKVAIDSRISGVFKN